MAPIQNKIDFAQPINIAPIFDNDCTAHQAVCVEIGRVLEADGVFIAAGLPDGTQFERRANSLLAFFDLPAAAKLRLATTRMQADSPRSYRGYVSSLKDGWAYNEYFDIGPERATPAPAITAAKIFAEANCWPAHPPFAEWRAEMLRYHQAMEKTGAAILRAAADFLGLAESDISTRFRNAGSTVRLLNYPRRPDGTTISDEMPEADGTRLITGRHVDAAALSLLWQREAGLQAQTPDGRWLDIPLCAGTVSVHLGTVMEFLSGGRWPATPHRVIDSGAARGSIGYFHEPNLDADLSPLLPVVENSGQKNPGLTYGAHLLERFGRYEGLEHLVTPVRG
ncbi:MAG: isopenicillin N synthase family oxygenase [Rhodospirillaceae bacterium]|nr:isopenicillin N synthase family oxygenase [Rhodospirillaceae bacterium]